VLIKRAANVAISRAIADDLPCRSEIIGDPYDESLFRLQPPVARDVPLAFLGRLVSDKGVDVLLEALAKLRVSGLAPTLHIIGQGTEERNLRALTVRLGLAEQVHFLGQKTGADLATYLQRVQMLVVPSRWAEPFGVVALEGMACGCLVVGSEAGGLKEAIGPAGVTIPNGDCAALADVLRQALQHPKQFHDCHKAAPAHLEKHQSINVARQYLDLFRRLLTTASEL
jgi:glycosyltransferase involved in cell wall biosynthesis